MCQCGQTLPHAVQPRGVEFGGNHAFPFGQHGQDFAPGVDNHAVAEGAAAVFVQAALSGRQNVALVFHRTGAQQQFPMRLAGGVGEGGGQQKRVKPALGAEKFGEAQVVANALRQIPAVGSQVGDFAAGGDGVSFGVAFAQTRIAEQVHFVVAADTFAVFVVCQQAVPYFAGCGRLQRNRAAEQGNAAFGGGFGHRLLQGAAAERLGQCEFVAVVLPHQRPIFGQQRPIRTLLCRLAH